MRIPLQRNSFWHGSLACAVAILAALAAWRAPRTHAAGPAAPRRFHARPAAGEGALPGRQGASRATRARPADLFRARPARHRPDLHRRPGRPEPPNPWPVRLPAPLRQLDDDRARAGEGPARLRRRPATASRRSTAAVYCFLNSPKITATDRRAVQEPRDRRLQGDDRRARSPDREGPQADRELGRDLRPRDAQREGPHRPLATASRGTRRSRTPGSAPRARAGSSTPRGDTTSGRGGTRTSRTCSTAASAGRRGATGRCPSRSRPSSRSSTARRRRRALPNYIPGKKWGTVGDPITRIQEPLPAGRVDQAHDRAAGLRRQARSPPTRTSRSRSAWRSTSAGRLWVAETFDYPNHMQPEGAGPRPDHHLRRHQRRRRGRQVHRLRRQALDPDQHGLRQRRRHRLAGAATCSSSRTPTATARPTSARSCSPAWAPRDTHAEPSNLRWGLDGWIYGTCGYSGFSGEVGGQHVSLRAGRLPLQAGRLGRSSSSSAPPTTTPGAWASARTARSSAPPPTTTRLLPRIPNRYFETVRGWSPHRPADDRGRRHFWPITEQVRQVDQHGGYTAGAGHALYTARSFPRNYWNRINFVAEPTGHLLGQFELIPNGGAASRSATTSTCWPATTSGPRRSPPTSAPTGRVWMIDWYNFIVQHNPVPKGFQVGKGGAYETPLRDKRHGRVYRITFKDGKPSQTFDLVEGFTRTTGRGAQEREHALADARPAAAGRARE